MLYIEVISERFDMEFAPLREQAQNYHLIGVGYIEIKHAGFSRQNDFTNDVILRSILQFRHTSPAIGQSPQPGGERQ